MEKVYLTVKEVAEMLLVKPVTVYKWIGEGVFKGSVFKIGGVHRFNKDSMTVAFMRPTTKE